MSYTGDGVAQTQAFAHARKQLASNDKIAQLEGFTTRIPTDGDKHVSVFSQVCAAFLWTLSIKLMGTHSSPCRHLWTTSTRVCVQELVDRPASTIPWRARGSRISTVSI